MTTNKANDKIEQIDKFHKTRKGRVTFGLIELIVAYIFISLAINSGSIWQYVIAIILIIGAFNNLLRAFVPGGVKLNGKKPAKKH
jgi:hypothetical protein